MSDSPSSTPAVAPAGGKRQAPKGTTKPGRGKKCCRGCSLWFPVDSYYPHDPYCTGCSSAVKRLQRLAKAQGQSDLFTEIKKDTGRLGKLLRKYKEEASGSDTFRKPNFSWMRFQEHETAERQTRRRSVSTLMHEEQFLEWSSSVAGGRVPAGCAKARWETLRDNKEVPRDHGGPGGCLRLCVEVETQVLQDEVFAVGRTLLKGEKDSKLANLSDGQVAAKRRRLAGHFDQIEDSTEDTRADRLRQLVGSKGDTAVGESADIGDLGSLMDFVSEEEEQVPEVKPKVERKKKNKDSALAEDLSEKQLAAQEQRAEKIRAKWRAQRDEKILLSKEKCSRMVADVQASLKSEQTKLEALMARPLSSRPLAQPWTSRAGVLVKLSKLLLDEEHGADKRLEEFIRPFAVAAEKGSGASSSSKSGGVAPLPAATLDLLSVAAIWLQALEDIDDVTSEADLKDFVKEFCIPKPAYNELVGAMKRINSSMSRCLVMEEKSEAKVAAAAGRGSDLASGKEDRTEQNKGGEEEVDGLNGEWTVQQVVECLQRKPEVQPVVRFEVGKVHIAGEGETKVATWGMPLLVTKCQECLTQRVDSVVSFARTTFMKSDKIKTEGRGVQRPRTEAVRECIYDVLASALGPCVMGLSGDGRDTGCIWAMLAESGHIAIHQQAQLTLATTGTRCVCMFERAKFEVYLNKDKGAVEDGQVLSATEVQKNFQLLQTYDGGIWMTEVDKHEVLYVPKGWVTVEMAHGETLIGIRANPTAKEGGGNSGAAMAGDEARV